MTDRMEELAKNELNNNEELRQYCNEVRRIHHDLYLELNWTASQLEAKLANIKGIMNKPRAKAIANEFRSAAEESKDAAARVQKAWTKFQQQFSEELRTARSSTKKPKEDFKII